MSALSAPPSELRSAPGTTQRWQQLRFGLLAAMVVAVGLFGGFATAPATFSDLKAGIVAGEVEEVTIAGGLPPQATGYAHTLLTWRAGGRPHYVEVAQASDVAELPPAQMADKDHVIGSIEQPLRALDGGGTLRFVSAAETSPGSSVAGWLVPGWLVASMVLVGLGSLVLLQGGPEPWWATRWAWFWVLFSPLWVVTVPVFLLLSGAPPGVPQPASLGRRLTGGWAFLGMTVLGGVLPSALVML